MERRELQSAQGDVGTRKYGTGDIIRVCAVGVRYYQKRSYRQGSSDEHQAAASGDFSEGQTEPASQADRCSRHACLRAKMESSQKESNQASNVHSNANA